MADPTAIQKRLLRCVERYDIDGVRILIEAGANINHVWNAEGATALSLAICCRVYKPNPSVNMVNELLALGADTSAGRHGNLIFEAIDAVGYGGANPDLVAALVAAGADVQAKTHYSYYSEIPRFDTPLHAVLKHIWDPKKAVAVANLLIKAGAPVDEKSDLGKRPLDYALRIHHHAATLTDTALGRALAKCLLRAGAATTGLADDLKESPAKTLVELVIKRGGWKKYALWHKQVLVGLVTKCQPMPVDAAGLVVDFYCPSGGS